MFSGFNHLPERLNLRDSLILFQYIIFRRRRTGFCFRPLFIQAFLFQESLKDSFFKYPVPAEVSFCLTFKLVKRIVVFGESFYGGAHGVAAVLRQIMRCLVIYGDALLFHFSRARRILAPL